MLMLYISRASPGAWHLIFRRIGREMLRLLRFPFYASLLLDSQALDSLLKTSTECLAVCGFLWYRDWARFWYNALASVIELRNCIIFNESLSVICDAFYRDHMPHLDTLAAFKVRIFVRLVMS